MQSDHPLGHSHRLEKLYKWLNYELSGIVLFGLSFFSNVAFILVFLAVIIFTPYLLYVLFREDRYGWLLSFGLFVVIPAFLSYYLLGVTPRPGYSLIAGYQMLAGYIPVAFFFFYCYILKLSIPGMIDE